MDEDQNKKQTTRSGCLTGCLFPLVAIFVITIGLFISFEIYKAFQDAKVRNLCAKDGGIRVYEQVVLPPEKFNQWGQVNFYEPTQGENSLGAEYLYTRKVEYYAQGAPALNPGEISVKRTFVQVNRRTDMKLLGEMVLYIRAGGDMPGPWKPTAFTCPDIQTTNEEALFAAIFINQNMQR
ncbi:MAG: hypothetical protein H6R04_1795 [Burkholderiaceae bacterium]|nr:hypothetical protein [Burkholderiaceae bacterium]